MWLEIFLIILTLYLLRQILKAQEGIPPGPLRLPIIGYIPWNERGPKIFYQLQEKYGDIVSLKVGSRSIVLLFNYKLMREAFAGHDIVDRPPMRILSLLATDDKYNYGIIATNGLHWQNVRRFSLRLLRDLGMGKSKLVEAIQFEATQLVNDMKKIAGKPSHPPPSIVVSVLNVVWQMTASKRYDLYESGILEFQNLVEDIQNNVNLILLPDFFPWIKYIVPQFLLNKLTKNDVFKKLAQRMEKFLEDTIEDHIRNLDQNDDPKDFVDAYLIEMEKQKKDPTSTMSIQDLKGCIADLFGAGMETTTITLHWAMYYLAKFPHVQEKLQKEIDNVLPKDTQARIEDKQRLPYMDAFIHEVLRYSSLAAVGGFHMASVDTKLGGYTIPKGTYVLAVTTFPHYTSEYFNSPEEFQPERYLTPEGKFQNPKEGFVPFGIGKRQCLGESLARMELFVFLTTMIQHLTFATPPGKAIDITPMENPFLHKPKEQDILITVR